MDNKYYIVILIIIIIFFILYYIKHTDSFDNSEHYDNMINVIEKDTYKECNKIIPKQNFNFKILSNEPIKIKPCELKQPTNYNYVNIGCYHDNTTRLIPIYITNVKSVCEAIVIANKYGAPLFGIQNNGELYIGHDPIKSVSLGLASGLCNELGDSWINQVYVAPLLLPEPKTYRYHYIGCYLDSPEHLIPIFIARVVSIDDAITIANNFGATVFGIQNDGDLYLGYDIIKAKMLGPCPIDYNNQEHSGCNILGNKLKNQLYYVF